VLVEAAPAFFQPGTIYMACGEGGYVGLVRLEDGRLDIAAALDPRSIKSAGGLGKAAVRILGETGWPAIDCLEDLPWRGTPELTRRAPYLTEDRLFVLGDAAGYVEPFTGEGIGWAVASATAVAPLAARAVRAWDPALARRWHFLYRQIVTRRQRICRLVARVLRRPRLMGAMVTVLAQAPWLATPFVRRLNRSSLELGGPRR
jgi:flavin-dependent dehydrogenase